MIVIDASAIVDALVGDPANPALLAIVADEEFHAPSLIDYEVASALRGHSLARKLADRHLEDAIADFAGLHLERYPLSTTLGSVLDLRRNFTAHDAAYLVLAQALEAPLVTAGAKLKDGRELGVEVRVLQPLRR